MKYITKPEGNFAVEQLISWLVNTADRYNRTGAGIRLGARIEDAVTASAGKQYIELQPDHYAGLAEEAESPSAGYPPLYASKSDGSQERLPGAARAWLACIDAIKNATDAPPQVALHAAAE
jgi:hypothetical protein